MHVVTKSHMGKERVVDLLAAEFEKFTDKVSDSTLQILRNYHLSSFL
jgi:hypothetical protein